MEQGVGAIQFDIGVFAPEPECRVGAVESHAWSSVLDFGAEGEICYAGFLRCARCGKTIRTHPKSGVGLSMSVPPSYYLLATSLDQELRMAGHHFSAFAAGILRMMEPRYVRDAISRELERRIRSGESLEAAHALAAGAYCHRDGNEIYPVIQSIPAPAQQVIEATFALSRWDGFGGGSIAKAFAAHPIQPPAEKRAFDADSRRMMNRILVSRGGKKRSNPMGRKR